MSLCRSSALINMPVSQGKYSGGTLSSPYLARSLRLSVRHMTQYGLQAGLSRPGALPNHVQRYVFGLHFLLTRMVTSQE